VDGFREHLREPLSTALRKVSFLGPESRARVKG
jgi:hypothetical protein